MSDYSLFRDSVFGPRGGHSWRLLVTFGFMDQSLMLHYETHGSPEQPTLCFLHGFMGSSDDWAALVDALSEDYFCLTVDLPGHGDSRTVPEHFYTMEGTAQAVVDVFDDAEVDRCTLIGYSMGGRVALYLSLVLQPPVERLVLESASPGLRSEEEQRERRQVDHERAERIEEDLDGFLEHWYRQPLFASLEEHDLVDDMVATRRQNDPSELARALRGLSPGRQPSLWNRLPDLEIPALLLTGALDSKYEAVTAQAAARMDTARRRVIPRAGHNVHAERPEAFEDALRQFLVETSPGGSRRS